MQVDKIGKYKTRVGDIVEITITATKGDSAHETGRMATGILNNKLDKWYINGRYFYNSEHPCDLVEFIPEEEKPLTQLIPPSQPIINQTIEQYRNQRTIELAEKVMVALIRSRATLVAQEIADLSFEVAEHMVIKEQNYGN